jgi:cytochrome c oxidase subunit 3
MYVNVMLNCTLILAILFMIFQIIEYFISPVNIDTGIYGSTFYMITGLHGFHVFIGTCFLLYCRTAVDMN